MWLWHRFCQFYESLLDFYLDFATVFVSLLCTPFFILIVRLCSSSFKPQSSLYSPAFPMTLQVTYRFTKEDTNGIIPLICPNFLCIEWANIYWLNAIIFIQFCVVRKIFCFYNSSLHIISICWESPLLIIYWDTLWAKRKKRSVLVL